MFVKGFNRQLDPVESNPRVDLFLFFKFSNAKSYFVF